MSALICPDCEHPVDRHAEFFCLECNCMCNSGKVAAEAKAKVAMLTEVMDKIHGLAMTGLPIDGYTIEDWNQHKLFVIEGYSSSALKKLE